MGRLAPVYPRGYGEHFFLHDAAWSIIGLSPWIRGAHFTGYRAGLVYRFIPVDTGSTSYIARLFADMTVYPRGYGEHPNRLFSVAFVDGLSPWIRGALAKQAADIHIGRFIPVDTGSTRFRSGSWRRSPVYPRGYGEHASADS